MSVQDIKKLMTKGSKIPPQPGQGGSYTARKPTSTRKMPGEKGYKVLPPIYGEDTGADVSGVRVRVRVRVKIRTVRRWFRLDLYLFQVNSMIQGAIFAAFVTKSLPPLVKTRQPSML